jgi:hypothetical protein
MIYRYIFHKCSDLSFEWENYRKLRMYASFSIESLLKMDLAMIELYDNVQFLVFSGGPGITKIKI